MSSYSDLEMKVVQWGEARGIVQNGQPTGQAKKTVEEAAELLEATAELRATLEIGKLYPGITGAHWYKTAIDNARAKAKDAIGDTLVTLIMCAATLDVSVVECLELAYNEIKDRKGYLRPDGVFVKES